MLIKPKRNYRITTDSHHRFRKHENMIKNMPLEQPEQVWVSDITYIGGRDRNCYLALVTDVYSKRIMGYDVSKLSNRRFFKGIKYGYKTKDA